MRRPCPAPASSPSNGDQQLAHLRAEMDFVNQNLRKTLLARWRLSMRIARLKQKMGRSLRDRIREEEMLSRIRKHRGGTPSENAAFERIFIAVMRETRRLQRQHTKMKRKNSNP